MKKYCILILFLCTAMIISAQQNQDPYYNFVNGIVGLAFDGVADDFLQMTYDPSIINSDLKTDVNQLMTDISSVSPDDIIPFTVLMDNCNEPSRCYYTFIIYKSTGTSLAEIQVRFFDEGDFLIDDFNFISKKELEAIRDKKKQSPVRF